MLATTDLHAHLLPFDYYADRPMPATGLAQAGHLIRVLRAEMPPGACLLLDNGDALTGGLLSDLLADRPAGPHPMIAAMNALGYDAAALGNHEFDRGLPALRAALAPARFPMLCANLRVREGLPLALPSVLLDRDLPGPDGARHRLRIGLLGLAPPQSAAWNGAALAGGLEARDILDAAREEIPCLRAAGADLVIALCHSGLGPAAPEPGMENAALPLAALPGLDALVLGHTHATFPDPRQSPRPGVDPQAGTLHGRPAVQPGFHGSHVGLLDLDLAHDGTGWRVASHRAQAIPVSPDLPPDPGLSALAEPTHAALRALAGRPVGRSEVHLQSYFSLLRPDATLDVVADAQRAEARRLLSGRPEAALPILCAVAPFKAGGRGGPDHYIDIPPGPLALRQVADLYLHPNALGLLEVKGADLREWLERSASAFRQLEPGQTDQPLLDPAVPSHNVDIIDGLAWTLDPTRLALSGGGGRIADLTHEGRPVTDGDRFVLATNSYRLGAGGGYGPATRARVLLRSGPPMRDVLLAHVRAAPVAPARRPRWRFASLPGTAAWFDTGPGALAHLPEGRAIEPLGPAEGGFHRFRLRL